jgi:hypothetical protein
LLVLGGQPTSLDHALGFSDFLCVYPGTREGASPPTKFAVRLDESNVVKLSWDSLGGQASYTLVATRFDTSLTRSIPLTANQTSYEEDTLGRTTCYRLTARTVVAELGRADTVCAAPGIANLGSTGDLRDLGAALDQLRSSP